MGQTIGTIQPQKLSESEFLYEWHFCKVNFDLVYWSPPFGFTCKEFSRCYLEMRPNIINRVLTFYLRGCEGGSGSKISSNAVLVDGKTISCRSNEYDACLDIEPSMKIFEINLSDPMFSSCFDYILLLKIKLHCYSAFLTSIMNENNSLQNVQNKTVLPTPFNEEPTSYKPLKDNTATSTSSSELPTSYKPLKDNTATSTSFSELPTSYKPLKDNTATSTSFSELPTIYKPLKDNTATSTSISELPSCTKYLEKNRAPSTSFSNQSRSGPNLVHTKELVEDLQWLHTSGNMSDIEIRIDKEILHAHKLILCARSPVFKKILECDTLESSHNSITITDCPAIPFKKFLKYIYTGEMEDSKIDIVMSLYALGDKYNVRALPEACSNILQSKLSSESVYDVANVVCDVLQLAERHNDSKLQDLAASFIANHFPMVSKKQNWKDLMKSNVELTSKILALVAAGLQNIKF